MVKLKAYSSIKRVFNMSHILLCNSTVQRWVISHLSASSVLEESCIIFAYIYVNSKFIHRCSVRQSTLYGQKDCGHLRITLIFVSSSKKLEAQIVVEQLSVFKHVLLCVYQISRHEWTPWKRKTSSSSPRTKFWVSTSRTSCLPPASFRPLTPKANGSKGGFLTSPWTGPLRPLTLRHGCPRLLYFKFYPRIDAI